MSRWNATKDLSWEPVRAERVVEVRYEHVLSGRFRHTARFVRWRDDKLPRDCTYDQLEARSEEHTSELQSLMRISYAVFCLKNKTKNETINYIHNHDTHN